MARQAMLLDIQAGVVLRIGQDRASIIIGLSKTNELLCVPGNKLEKSEVVLELCRIKSKADGHWLLPSLNLPTSVNDIVTRGHVLLRQGSVIKVGDRYMRYSVSSLSRPVTSENNHGYMTVSQGLTDLSEAGIHDGVEILTASTTFDPTAVYASMASLGDQRTSESDSTAAPDPDLIQFLRTNNGLAHMTAAIVSQHVFLYTSLKLSATEIDSLFLSFEHVTSWEDACFNTFLCEYEHLFAEQDEQNRHTSNGVLETSACIHAPVIHLLTSLLKVSLDPIIYNVIWLRIMAVLSKCTKSHDPLVAYKSATAVLGCMAARADVTSVQEYGCRILSRVADYKPSFGEKGPIREGAIQLVISALQTHSSVPAVTRNALRFFGNLTQTYARLAMDAVNTREFSSLDEQRSALILVMSMLNIIEDTAVPIVKALPAVYTSDEDIQLQIRRIMSYFQDNRSQTENESLNGNEIVPMPDQESMEAQVESHFNQTQDLTDLIADVAKNSIPRKERDSKDADSKFDKQDITLKRTRNSKKKKVKFEEPRVQIPEGDDSFSKNDDAKNTSSSSDSSFEERRKSRSYSTSSSSDNGSVKNGTGMLAFAVRKKSEDKNSSSKDVIEPSTDVTDANQSSEPSIISGVEFFTDDDDIARSDNETRNNSINSNNKHSSSDEVSTDKKSDKLHDGNYGSSQLSQNNDAGNVCDSKDVSLREPAVEMRKNKQLLSIQTPKSFVSQTALDAGVTSSTKDQGSSNSQIHKKRSSIFDKLSKKSSKPKKRFSILSTEYSQKQTKENVQLNATNLLFGVLERPIYTSRSFDEKNKEAQKVLQSRSIQDDVQVSPDQKQKALIENPQKATKDVKPLPVLINSRPTESLDLGSNVSRYVNIFCNMSKRKQFKDTISIASSEDSADHKRSKFTSSHQAADFVKRTRKLLHDGKGKYDIAEAAIRASFPDKRVSGLSYIPLSLSEHGHDFSLRGSISFRQDES